MIVIKKYEKINMLYIVLFIAPFLMGLASLWGAYILDVLLIGTLIYKIVKNKKLIIPKGINFYIILLFVFSYLVVEFYAIDKGMNILAFLKMLTIPIFILFYLQYECDDDEKLKLYDVIALSGAVSVIFSILLSLLGLKGYFFAQNRLQGVFLYANSYGLFLLVCLVFKMLKKEMKIIDFIEIGILILGIALTNSRAIIILTGITFIVNLILNKENRKGILLSILPYGAIVVIAYIIFNMNNRLATGLTQSSEFVTRLLYYKDGITLIKNNIFGYGYLGWYYIQGKIETGVYDCMFIHNSLLQVIIDVGIVPAIALIYLLFKTFINKGLNKQERLIFILILGHSIIDFDLEFIYFIILITMMIKFENKSETINKVVVNSILSISLIIYVILMSATLCNAGKSYQNASQICPIYTEAMVNTLYVSNEDERYELAKKIYKLNQNVSPVYEVLSEYEQKNNNYDQALIYEERKLELNKYTMQNYLDYTKFLESAMRYYYALDKNKSKFYMEKILDVDDKIQYVIDTTNPLCYKTIHKPNLDIPEFLTTFINQIQITYESM